MRTIYEVRTEFAVPVRIECVPVLGGAHATTVFVDDHTVLQGTDTVPFLVNDHTRFFATRDAKFGLVFRRSRWADTVAVFVKDLSLLHWTHVGCETIEKNTYRNVPEASGVWFLYGAGQDKVRIITFVTADDGVPSVPRNALANHSPHRGRVQHLAIRVHSTRPDLNARINTLTIEASGLGWTLVIRSAFLCYCG